MQINGNYNGCVKSPPPDMDPKYLPISFRNEELLDILHDYSIELCYSFTVYNSGNIGIIFYLNKGEQRSMTLKKRRFQPTEIIGEIHFLIFSDEGETGITWLNVNPEYMEMDMRGFGIGTYLILLALSYSNHYAPEISVVELDDDSDNAANIDDSEEKEELQLRNIYYKLGFRYESDYGPEMKGVIQDILRNNVTPFLSRKGEGLKDLLYEIDEGSKKRRLNGGADSIESRLYDFWSKDFIPIYEIIQFYRENRLNIIGDMKGFLDNLNTLKNDLSVWLKYLRDSSVYLFDQYLRSEEGLYLNKLFKEVLSEKKTYEKVLNYLEGNGQQPLYRRILIENYKLRGGEWFNDISNKINNIIQQNNSGEGNLSQDDITFMDGDGTIMDDPEPVQRRLFGGTKKKRTKNKNRVNNR